MKQKEFLVTLFKANLEHTNAHLLEMEKLFNAVVSKNVGRSPSEIVVGKNNCIVVRIGEDHWACPLSSKECNFLQTLLQNGGKMQGNNIKQWGIDPDNDISIRNFLKSINRKLAAKKMPVRIRFVDWIFTINIVSF